MPYLVIQFDRYNTEQSKYYHLEADSPVDAIINMYKEAGCEEDELEEIAEYIPESLITVDEIFSCVPGEEEDILVYLR